MQKAIWIFFSAQFFFHRGSRYLPVCVNWLHFYVYTEYNVYCTYMRVNACKYRSVFACTHTYMFCISCLLIASIRCAHFSRLGHHSHRLTNYLLFALYLLFRNLLQIYLLFSLSLPLSAAHSDAVAFPWFPHTFGRSHFIDCIPFIDMVFVSSSSRSCFRSWYMRIH